MENIGIYCWTSPSGKKYIGQSVNLKKRKSNFLNFKRGYTSTGYNKINNARKKYNKESDWKYDILEYCLEDRLDEREIFWISYFNTVEEGYNSEYGGGTNKIISDDTRRKLSEKKKDVYVGENNPFYGRHHSEETRKRISESHKGKETWMKGKHHSEESRKKISIAKSNPSEETRRKISESNKGRKPVNRKPVLQYSKEGEFIREFETVTSASIELGIEITHICAVCKGKLKTSGGYKWKYKDESN